LSLQSLPVGTDRYLSGLGNDLLKQQIQ